MVELTGKTRYRNYKPNFDEPLLVLQVEYTYLHYSMRSAHKVSAWRDATVEDLTDIVFNSKLKEEE
jgi:hypothetical protein